ncbi:MAG: hypothetical protein ACFC1C_02555 [Candidatus Malihini olakiniferum]
MKILHGRLGSLAFSQGIIGLVRQIDNEPINLVDAQARPSFKCIPSIKEHYFHSFS